MGTLLIVLGLVGCAVVGIYFLMTPMQRLAYRMRVRASFSGAGRCRECGNRALSGDFPFCSEDHADKHAAATAW